MNGSGQRERARAAQEAADWLIASRAGLDDVQQDVFNEWLKIPENAEEYLEAEQLAQDLRESVDPDLDIAALIERARADVDEDDDDTKVRPIPVRAWRTPRPAARGSWVYLAAAAAVAAIILSIPWLSPSHTTPTPIVEQITTTHFATRHGEQSTQRLADGTQLRLDTDTSVTVRFSSTVRRVEVESGQVNFAVAHDAIRPFRVMAGSAEIVDVGTTFDVYLRPDSTVVTVVEGRVKVSLAPPGRGGLAGVLGIADSTEVAAGQQLRVAEGRLPSSAVQVDTDTAIAWQRGQIAFHQEPLGDVVAQFNRYAATPIEIDTPTLRELRISGVFANNDTESFVAFLRTLKGVQVDVTPTRIRIFKG